MVLRRRLAVWIAALVTFVMGAASAHAQTAVSRESGDVEATLVDVRVGQVATLAMRATRHGARAWLPVAELAAALELDIVHRSARRVTLRRWPSRELITFDLDSTLVRIGAVAQPRDAGALRMIDEDLAADVATLQAILRTPFEISWSDLVVSLPVIDSLPIGRRIAREQARARLRAQDMRPDAADAIAPLARPIADGAVVDYSLTMPIAGGVRTPGWSTALGLDVLGGSLEVSTGGVPGGTQLPTLASWTGVWREGRALSQLRLGDGLGGGPSPRLGRGIMLTNAPYVRPSLFGLKTLRGELPPGWSIEAYRNGELVAVDTVGRGGGYQLQLPVLYGENPVDLLAVGPFGQTRALSENVRILSDLLPRDRSEYSASLSQCRLRQQCVAAATADLRIGLTERWTMRVGVDALARDSVGWRVAPYFSFIGAPIPSLAVQLDAAAQSHTRLALNLDASQQTRITLEQQLFSADALDPLRAAFRSSQSSLYAVWRSLGARQTSVEASLDRSVYRTGGDLLRARLGVATQTALLRVQPYLRLERFARAAVAQGAAGVEAMLLPDARRGPYLGAATLRVISEVTARGAPLRQAVTLAMPMPGAFRMDLGVATQRGQRGPLMTLTVSRDLNALRSYTAATASSGVTSLQQSVQGSAVLSRQAQRIAFVPGPSLQRTGATGLVFLDRNGNGAREHDEPVIPDVTVQIGTGFARSDADGRYRIWDLVPFVPLPVSVDSTSVPSPLWIPSIRHASIEAGPNRLEPLDVPLIAGGVLEGRIIWHGRGGTSLPAVPITVHSATGALVARAQTFSDGEFVLFGVRPGPLTVRVDSVWLRAHGLESPVQSVLLRHSDEGETVRVPPINLRGAAQNPVVPAADSGGTRNVFTRGDTAPSEIASVTISPLVSAEIMPLSPTAISRDAQAGAADTASLAAVLPTVPPAVRRALPRAVPTVPTVAPPAAAVAPTSPGAVVTTVSPAAARRPALRPSSRAVRAPVVSSPRVIASTVSTPLPHPSTRTRRMPSGPGAVMVLRVSGLPRTVADAVMVAPWPAARAGVAKVAARRTALTESWRTRDISTGISTEIRRNPSRASSR